MNIKIMYEDKDIIVAEKPPNIPSQKDPSGDPDMVSYVKDYLAKASHIPDPYVGLHHRLDRPVGGLMAFAKTKKGNKVLSHQIQERTIKKQYLVVVCGTPSQEHGTLENFLKKIGNRNQSKVVPANAYGAKRATLHFEVLETIESDISGPLTLLRIHLETGRHHQIRVQLAYANLPVLGDAKYNKKRIPGLRQVPLALWAYSLQLQTTDGSSLNLVSYPHDHPGFSSFHIR